MPIISFNVTTAQGQLLLSAFAERYPDYGGPATDLQKGKQIIVEVMRDYLHNLKRRQALALVDDSDTEMS